MSRVLNLILSHQTRGEVEWLLKWWSHCSPLENILLAYGGARENFNSLPDVQRVFIDDPRLRVAHKQRDKQSYGGVWRAAAAWLAQHPQADFTHVYFAECDQLPLIPDLANRLIGRLTQEGADVLGHGVHRIDGTSNSYYLYHIHDPCFEAFWRRISVRSDKQVVFWMMGTGSFWTRRAFLAVASQHEEIKAYVEVYLPTLAHHLGFRVRDFRDQHGCVSGDPLRGLSVESARRKGCWTMHPIKDYGTVCSSPSREK
jgi:hypothetical protein